MSAINDPLGQTHSPASSYHYSHLKVVFVLRDFEKWGRTDVRTDGQTPRAKIVITTDRDRVGLVDQYATVGLFGTVLSFRLK